MEINLNGGTCWICGSKANSLSVPSGGDYSHQHCEQCGEFKITRSAMVTVGQYRSPEEVIKLSGWVLHENREDRIPTLYSYMLEDIANRSIPGLEERATSLLVEIRACQSEIEMGLNVTEEPRCYAATFIPRADKQGKERIIGLARILEDKGFVKLQQSLQGAVRLTLAGYRETNRLRAKRTGKWPTPVDPQPPKGPPDTTDRPNGPSPRDNHKYQVALSYASEQREYVEKVAQCLKARGISVFFDVFEESELWGALGSEVFYKVFAEQSMYVVMFISKEYRDKVWPRHEKRAALSRMIEEQREYVLPVRFDNTKIEGLPGDMIYLKADEYEPVGLSAKIAEKLEAPRLIDAKPSEPMVALRWMGEVVSDPRYRGWIKPTHWGNDTHSRSPQRGRYGNFGRDTRATGDYHRRGKVCPWWLEGQY